MRFPALLAAALLGGCAADTSDSTLDHVFDVCEPIAVRAGPGAGDEEVASLDVALDMWNRLGETSLVRGDGEGMPGDPILEVRFETAAPVFYGVYDDETGVVFVNRRLRDPHERAVTIAHELGHAFGLFHVSGRRSVMNAQNLVVEPTASDADDLIARWGDCATSP